MNVELEPTPSPGGVHQEHHRFITAPDTLTPACPVYHENDHANAQQKGERGEYYED